MDSILELSEMILGNKILPLLVHIIMYLILQVFNFAFFMIEKSQNLKTSEYKSLWSQKKMNNINLITMLTYTVHCTLYRIYMYVSTNTDKLFAGLTHTFHSVKSCVLCCEITLTCSLFVLFYLDLLKSLEDWKIKSSWECLNRKI